MTALSNMALRQRLIIRLLVVLGVSLLLAAAMIYWRAASKVRTELHAALTVGEQVLLDAVSEVERSPSPYQQIRLVIERFSGGRHLRVTLLDGTGQHVAESRIEKPEEPAPEWFYRLVGGEPELVRAKLPANIKGYSHLLLEADPRNEVQEVWEEVCFGLLVIAALSGLAGTLIYRSIGWELAPLDNLNNALSQVAKGNFDVRVPEHGSADLRTVAQGFNEMVVALEDSRIMTARLEEQLSSVQEEERAELARDLHDEIGPQLFSVGIDATEAKHLIGSDAGRDVHQRLDAIRESVRISQKHVLRLLGRLRNGTVDDLGLNGAVAQLVAFWAFRQPNVTINSDVPDESLGGRLDSVVYRVVQESVSNAIRHGKPSQIDVLVARTPGGETKVTVCDNGSGLISSRAGYGLTGMKERVTSMCGTLDVRSRDDGRGTIVCADFPPNEALYKNQALQASAAP